jgi:hypothetical protein
VNDTDTVILELEEVWLPVPGYEGLYSISSIGRVRAHAKVVARRDGRTHLVQQRIMRPGISGKGYQSVGLVGPLGRRTHYVHHLVLTAFVGPMPEGQEACHGDGTPTNNHKGNLRWGTRLSNHADKKLHGTTSAGERHHGAKLTDATVLAIRKRVAQGAAPSTVGDEFGVSRQTGYRAATGKSWSHLGEVV